MISSIPAENGLLNFSSEPRRRPVTVRSPEYFRRLAFYHLLSGVLAVSCQIGVTIITIYCHDRALFHESTQASNVAKASVGIIAGAIYLNLGLYGVYMSRNLYAFRFELLKERLWLFNVFSGLSVFASLILFGASGFLAKSSAVWYDVDPTTIPASVLLALAVIMTIVSCFEVCIAAAGVFVK